MLLARPTPAVIPDSHGDWLILAETALYPSVEELARPEYRIAGLRINPANFAPSRQNFVSNISLKIHGRAKQFPSAAYPTRFMPAISAGARARNRLLSPRPALTGLIST